MTLRLARNDDNDAAAFCDLFNSLYTRSVDVDYYRWQFFAAPFPSLLALATDGKGNLAGTYGYHIKESNPGDKRIAWALDIMVTPDHQGKGLFRALADYAMEQTKTYEPVAHCVMANHHAYGAHIHGLGWKEIAVYDSYVRTGSGKSDRDADQVEFIQTDITDPGWTKDGNSWRRFVPDASLTSTSRSFPFVEWRFLRNPWYRYDCFRCERHGNVFGYLALKTYRDPKTGLAYGDIVDIVFEQESHEAVDAMLRFAIDRFCRQGITQVTIWLQTNTVLDDIGRKCGFVRTGQKRYFCGQVADPSYNQLLDSKQWFVTMADSEIY